MLIEIPTAKACFIRCETQEIVLAQWSQSAGQEVQQCLGGGFTVRDLLAPELALILPPALEVARQARADRMEILRLKANGRFAPLPKVIDIETNEQRIAFAQTVEFGDDIDARAQEVEGKPHLDQDTGDPISIKRIEL